MSPAKSNPRPELEERLRFETLIADLSSKFINLPAGEVDREIEDAQRRVCECLGFDLCALWQWTQDTPRYITISHLYRPLGGPPPPERIDGEEMAPWCLTADRGGKDCGCGLHGVTAARSGPRQRGLAPLRDQVRPEFPALSRRAAFWRTDL